MPVGSGQFLTYEGNPPSFMILQLILSDKTEIYLLLTAPQFHLFPLPFLQRMPFPGPHMSSQKGRHSSPVSNTLGYGERGG